MPDFHALPITSVNVTTDPGVGINYNQSWDVFNHLINEFKLLKSGDIFYRNH